MRYTKIKHHCILFVSNPLGQLTPSCPQPHQDHLELGFLAEDGQGEATQEDSEIPPGFSTQLKAC